MAERLSGGNNAIALLANALATGGALLAIIAAFGPISGAHLNPAVTLAEAWHHGFPRRDAAAYVAVQLLGAIAGVMVANLMFGLPAISASSHVRAGAGILLGEFTATFGLLAVIWGCSASSPRSAPFAVASYIVGAYWFTSSTSFANPAVTIARSLSDTFAGIRPSDVASFIAAQLAGAAAATAFFAWITPNRSGGRRESLSNTAYEACMKSVLFVCVQNGARSQMAEALVNQLCGGELQAESAGLEPGTLNPLAVAAMKEVGIDIGGNRTKSVFDLFKGGRLFDYVITVCDEASAEACPIFPGLATRLHWSFEDPSTLVGTAEEQLAKTRVVRDEIRGKVERWCGQVCRPLPSAAV